MGNLAETIATRMTPELQELLHSAGRLAGEMGYRAYAVGGMVRDLLLERDTFDLDIVVEGEGIRFARGLAGRLRARVKGYERFGTASVTLPGGAKVDVATARTEIYDEPAALPRVTPGSIRDDLFRRDFTINAMALSLAPGEFGRLLDEFGGFRDIRDGMIRVLHDRSFIDDPTRIFRAARFEARLGFRIVAADERRIDEALSLSLLERLEEYRIVAELRLILREPDPVTPLRRLEQLGVIAALEALRGKGGSLGKPLAKIRQAIGTAGD
jgi:tRNA nucleotidyltransferase (CCA-adding enzyme)